MCTMLTSDVVLQNSPGCVEGHEGEVVLLDPEVEVNLRQRHRVHAILVQVLFCVCLYLYRVLRLCLMFV